MKTALLLVVAMLLAGCATTKEPQYPSWLQMQDGWAEGCIAAGGCVPMSGPEIEAMLLYLRQQAARECRKAL